MVTGAAYGLGITLQAPEKALLERMTPALPPNWVENDTAASELRFELVTEDRKSYRIMLNDGLLLDDSLESMFGSLPSLLRQYLAAEARDVVFVHAGAVAYKGRGIVIPGKSFSGKTTLVTALVKAGAEYYSDEYAVIRPDGALLPYPKDLSLRLTDGERSQTERSIGELGGVAGIEPVKIGLLVLTEYRASAVWEPAELSVAQGVVGMLGHTEPVQERPEMALAAITQGLSGARVLQGRRGDADTTAAALLAILDS
jgi:hypothetical protein